MRSPHWSHLPQSTARPALVAVAAAALLAGCGDATTSTTAAGSSSSSPATASSEATTSASASPSSTTTAAPTPSSTATGAPAAGAHNDADVAFATGMVPHHEQALVMADMAIAHGGTDDFVALAKKIKAAQQPEIEQMNGWLTGWGEPPASGSHGGHGTGMMGQKDLDELDAMKGSGFEGMWLTMMVEHHQGAVEMARTEVTKGQNPEATTLAKSIIASQSAEIATMKAMADARAN